LTASIRRQLDEYKTLFQLLEGSDHVECICLIKLDITLNGICLRDQFEWDVNDWSITPETFSRSLVADMVK